MFHVIKGNESFSFVINSVVQMKMSAKKSLMNEVMFFSLLNEAKTLTSTKRIQVDFMWSLKIRRSK